ncbi:hypothetical protein Hanom_Chr12g01131001 [Helianthus anomalus]
MYQFEILGDPYMVTPVRISNACLIYNHLMHRTLKVIGSYLPENCIAIFKIPRLEIIPSKNPEEMMAPLLVDGINVFRTGPDIEPVFLPVQWFDRSDRT